MAEPSASSGQRAIVERALAANRTRLRAFVASRAAPGDVDDIIQTAAVRALERSESLDHLDRVVAWLYRIHRNVIVDAGRVQHRSRLVLDPTAVETATIEAPPEDPCGCVLNLNETLRPNYRSILRWIDVEGWSPAEVARRLGVSANNATVRLHRARRALRQRLLEHCGVSDRRECNDCRCGYDGCCPA